MRDIIIKTLKNGIAEGKSSAKKMLRAGLVSFMLALVLLLSACGEAAEQQKQLFAMGTTFTLTAYGKNAEKGISSAGATIQAIEAMSDPEIETSTCYALNHAQGDQLNISGQIAEMLLEAKEIYERTDGAYDLTIYPLSQRWGFTDGRYYVPTSEEIAMDLECLCMDKLIISRFPNSGAYAVSMPSYGSLSFETCEKGCAGKYAIDALKKSGVESAVVSLNGNVHTLGNKPDGTEWSIGIQDPKNPSGFLGVVSVGQTAVVTTGPYQQVMTGNTKYHHIINPKTGYPAANGLLSVTVICEDGTRADCLATAMSVLGQTKALNYWRQYGGFDMILINDSGEVVCTSGLLEKFDIRNENYILTYVE